MAEIYYVDGFDHGAVGQVLHKYLNYSRFEQSSITQGAQPNNLQGGGRALFMYNSAFWSMCYTRFVGARARQVVGFHYRTGPTSITQTIIFRWESQASTGPVGASPNDQNLGTQLSIFQKADGGLEFWSGGKGTNADKGSIVGSLPAGTFAINTWYHLEVDAKFGSGGWLKVYVDDELRLDSINLALGTASPDRFSLRWEAFTTQGTFFDDLVVADQVLGPCRVETTWPTSQGSLAQWSPTGMLAKHFDTVDEHLINLQTNGTVHDADATYLQAPTPGLDELFGFVPLACYAKILAVAANAVGKDPANLNAPVTSFLCKQGENLSVVTGQQWPASSRFGTSQGIFAVDPAGVAWTDGKLGAAQWGMRSAGVGISRVTLFYLEKVVTLRDVPFSCGKASSYAYGKT